jgi:archaellum component FlaG (FlaF/FlaG flagellin family)
MASTVSRPRLWLAILFLTAIAAAFVVSVTVERVRPMTGTLEPAADRTTRLAGTPFDTMADPSNVKPLNRAERLNVYLVVAIAQLAHIFVVAVVTALLYFVLGLILLSPELLAAWTRRADVHVHQRTNRQ